MELTNDILENAFMRLMTGGFGQRKDRQTLIEEHEKKLKDIDKKYNDPVGYNFNTTNNQGYRGSSKPVKIVLKNRISLASLELDKVQTGKFLLCRVLARSIKMTALSTIVEDPEGDVERLSLYNWVQQSSIPTKDRNKTFTTSKYLPIGTILAIKNPYYKVAADLERVIRSDNPSDVVILDDNSKLLSELEWSTDPPKNKEVGGKLMIDKKELSADDFRLRGNKSFASEDFQSAVNEYSGGIKLEPRNVTLLANRAEAYLRLNQFKNALNDVETVLEHDRDHLKAIFRKGKALCGLRRYQEAIVILQDLHKRIQVSKTNDSINKSTKELLKHAEMLNSENKNGQYDYIRIVDEYCEKSKIKGNELGDDDWVSATGPRLDHADYLINDIEIRSIKKKGRGWVAKCDIPEHTLLMVSKAFKVVFSNETNTCLDINWSTRITNQATQSELITSIAQKLMVEPDLCKEVYQLYAGPDLIPAEKLSEELLYSVDMKRIEGIVRYNTFEPKDRWKNLQDHDESNILKKDAGVGLWILPSYFNHSCIDTNVGQTFLGDLLFLRSSRPISKGEELTINYCDPMLTFEERSKKLNFYNITCQCRLCKLGRSEKQKIRLQRESVLENYENFIRPRVISEHSLPSLIKGLKETIDVLQDLRKEHPDLECDSFGPKTALAIVHAKNGHSRQSLSVMQEFIIS